MEALIMVNENNEKAHAFYRLSNFKLRGYYYTTFMQAENRPTAELTQ
jgi:hypothetical protein